MITESSLALLTPPVRIVPSARLNYEEFLAFCRANPPFRFEQNGEGEIVMMTPIGPQDANLEGYLFRELDLWTERTGLGVAVNSNAGFRLSDGSLRMPDAAWIGPERWQSLNSAERHRLAAFCPEFVIELRSPGDQLDALEPKMQQWITNGALLAWMIDPQRKLAVVYRQGQEPEIYYDSESLFGEGPVAGFRLEMRRFWA